MGLAILIVGIVVAIMDVNLRAKDELCTAQAKGTLTSHKKRRNHKGSEFHDYRYTYTVDGREYELRLYSCIGDAKEVGDTCTIWYNPEKPSQAIGFHSEPGKEHSSSPALGIVIAIVGFIILVWQYVSNHEVL